MANQRAQVQELNGPTLRPAARPVSTYVTPAPEPRDYGLQLADALKGIQPGLERFFDAEREEEKEVQTEAARAKIEGMTLEEAEKAVGEGTLSELENPWFRAAYMKQYGMRLAQHRKAGLLTDVESGKIDIATANIDETLKGIIEPDITSMGDNRFFQSGYRSTIDDARGTLLTAQSKARSEKINEDKLQGFFDIANGVVDKGIESKQTPDQIVAALRAQYSSHAQLLKLQPKQMDAELVRLSKTLADKGHTDIVRALLFTDRTGEDGAVVPAIGRIRAYAADAENIVLAAEKRQMDVKRKTDGDTIYGFLMAAREGKLVGSSLKQYDEYRKANPGVIQDSFADRIEATQMRVEAAQATKAAAASLRQARVDFKTTAHRDSVMAILDGDGLSITDQRGILPDGNEVSENGETLRREGLAEALRLIKGHAEKTVGTDLKKDRRYGTDEAYTKQVDEQVAAAGISAQVDLLTKNRMVNEDWKRVLGAGSRGVRLDSLEKADPNLVEAYNLFQTLKQRNAQLAADHVGDGDTLKFYRSVELMQRFRTGIRTEDAITLAVQGQMDPTRREALISGMRVEDLKKKATEAASTGIFGGANAVNKGHLSARIAETAKEYVATLGIGMDEAVKAAVEDIQETHEVVRGMSIDLQGTGIKKGQLPEMLEPYLDEIVKSLPNEPEGTVTAALVGVSPRGPEFQLIEIRNGVPLMLYAVMDEKPIKTHFTLRDLEASAKARQQAAIAASVARAAENVARDPDAPIIDRPIVLQDGPRGRTTVDLKVGKPNLGNAIQSNSKASDILPGLAAKMDAAKKRDADDKKTKVEDSIQRRKAE